MHKRKRKKALVLGIGNLLLRDEGLGVRTTEYFEGHFSFGPDVVCLDGGTSGLGILSYIEDYSHIIIVDAVAALEAPGKIFRIPGEEVQKWPALESSTAHQIGLRDLLAIARFQGLNPQPMIIGVIPAHLSPGLGRNLAIKTSFPLAAEAI